MVPARPAMWSFSSIAVARPVQIAKTIREVGSERCYGENVTDLFPNPVWDGGLSPIRGTRIPERIGWLRLAARSRDRRGAAPKPRIDFAGTKIVTPLCDSSASTARRAATRNKPHRSPADHQSGESDCCPAIGAGDARGNRPSILEPSSRSAADQRQS